MLRLSLRSLLLSVVWLCCPSQMRSLHRNLKPSQHASAANGHAHHDTIDEASDEENEDANELAPADMEKGVDSESGGWCYLAGDVGVHPRPALPCKGAPKELCINADVGTRYRGKGLHRCMLLGSQSPAVLSGVSSSLVRHVRCAGQATLLGGLILRSQLLVLLQRRHFVDSHGRPVRIHHTASPSLSSRGGCLVSLGCSGRCTEDLHSACPCQWSGLMMVG